MREFKYRVWDYAAEKMHYTAFAVEANGTILVRSFDCYTQSPTKERYLIEWMQYTGLKDKNGVEIYEGDILLGSFDYGRERHHIVEWCDMFAGFEPFCDYDSDCGQYFKTEQCVVIGNIYENPELLGGE